MKYAVEYVLKAPMGGVKLTGGRLKKAFDNNVSFLKGFDVDRMLYWYRVHQGKPAPGVPYASDAGHFENNLKGQTAGEFMMGAGASLLWGEDAELRGMVRRLLDCIEAGRESDGFILPITRDEFRTREYPNYTRAWITFGLLDAGYAGEQRAFELARGFGDFFNQCEVLPFVKDMNLGFQGILANTRLYDSPVGKRADIDTALKWYQEKWWLEELINDDQRAIYEHPGNHPHSTLLTTLEGYLDIYRATGEQIYIDAVRHALKMYEGKWQHVGGGINMCEDDKYFPGCNWLDPSHHYNELCSTNFWVLINQRMHRLFPDDAHYVDEMENSIYNVLLAAQVEDKGYHYLNFLERSKDWRWLDRATCCSAMGTRLAALLPQFLYTYTGDTVYADIYSQSEATLPLDAGNVTLRCETDMPESGHVRITVVDCAAPFTLKLRHPRWAVEGGKSYYETIEGVKAGDVFELDLPFGFKTTLYTGGEEKPREERWALEYGPLLYAAMGAPGPVHVSWNPEEPQKWFEPASDGLKLKLRGDDRHEYWPYLEIRDEPFSVYPVVTRI